MPWDIELVKFCMLSGTFLFSIITFYFTIRSKLIRLKVTSYLTLVDGKDTAVIHVTNIGERNVTVESVRFPFFCNDETLRLTVNGYLKFRRVLDEILGNSCHSYASDYAIRYEPDSFNNTLSEGEKTIAYIELNKMMEKLIASNPSSSLRTYFILTTIGLKIQVKLSNGKIVERRAHREIRHFLRQSYQNDVRLFRS